MAKKLTRRKAPASASSSKTAKSSAKTTTAKKSSRVSYQPKSKSARAKSKSSKKVNYKEQYIKLLEKTNKILTKEVSRKAIEKPQPKILPPDFEAFPKEEPLVPPSPQARPYRGRGVAPTTIEDEILGKLTDIEMEIRARDSQLDDLVHGSPRLTGGFGGN